MSGVLGTVDLVLEPLGAGNQGESTLLAKSAVSGTMSLTAAPSGSAGMRLHVIVYDNTVAGTVTIAGKDINGNVISEVIPPTGSIPIAPVGGQNSNVVAYEYETTNVFGNQTATSNAITTTGLTGGSIAVKGAFAGKFAQPCDFDFDLHYDEYSPDEFRGTFDRDFNQLQLRRLATVDKFDQDLYPETSLWFWYMMVNFNPTITTLPGTPTVLKASAAVTLTPTGLTTQPSLPGMKLQFVLTSVGAIGTIAITGTDIFGNAQTETITVPNVASQTIYSAKVYQTVGATGIAYTGMTGGSAAINGVFGFQYVFLPDATSNPYTASMEFFTGTDSGIIPFFALEEGNLEWSVNDNKAARLVTKGIAQDFLPIGDRSLTNTFTNRITSLALPLDVPFTGVQSQVFVDPITGTPGSTAYADLLTGKITLKWPALPKWTATVNQVMNRLYRKKRESNFMLTIDGTDGRQYEQYRKRLRQYFQFQWLGQAIGGGNNKSVTIVVPAHIEKFKRKPGIDKENVEVDLELRAFYDTGIGGSYKVVVVNQANPTYTA